MTPDEARALLDGTTPGPWEAETALGLRYYDGETWETPGKIEVYADEATLFVAADEFVGDEGDEHDNEKNVRLAAHAPDLAAMIAGMRAEYAVRLPDGSPVGAGWGTHDTALEDQNAWRRDGYDARLVRRYVTTPEEA